MKLRAPSHEAVQSAGVIVSILLSGIVWLAWESYQQSYEDIRFSVQPLIREPLVLQRTDGSVSFYQEHKVVAVNRSSEDSSVLSIWTMGQGPEEEFMFVLKTEVDGQLRDVLPFDLPSGASRQIDGFVRFTISSECAFAELDQYLLKDISWMTAQKIFDANRRTFPHCDLLPRSGSAKFEHHRNFSLRTGRGNQISASANELIDATPEGYSRLFFIPDL